MDNNRNSQHALLTAAAGVTLAAGAFALVRSHSRQRLDTVQSIDRLQWLCSDDATSATARSLLQLDSAVRNVRISKLKHEAKGSLKRVPSFERLTGEYTVPDRTCHVQPVNFKAEALEMVPKYHTCLIGAVAARSG